MFRLIAMRGLSLLAEASLNRVTGDVAKLRNERHGILAAGIYLDCRCTLECHNDAVFLLAERRNTFKLVHIGLQQVSPDENLSGLTVNGKQHTVGRLEELTESEACLPLEHGQLGLVEKCIYYHGD